MHKMHLCQSTVSILDSKFACMVAYIYASTLKRFLELLKVKLPRAFKCY